jgi:hypothetical protein
MHLVIHWARDFRKCQCNSDIRATRPTSYGYPQARCQNPHPLESNQPLQNTSTSVRPLPPVCPVMFPLHGPHMSHLMRMEWGAPKLIMTLLTPSYVHVVSHADERVLGSHQVLI